MGFDDAVDHRQSQTRALARRFGGEKGLEHTIKRGLIHARTGVTHREPHGRRDPMTRDRRCQQ